MTDVVKTHSMIDPIWKDRAERALKHICRTIDIKQRRDAIPLFASIAERYKNVRRPTIVSEPKPADKCSTLYTSCAYNELTGDNLTCTLSILPHIDQIPHMFTYVPLQRNFVCDTMTNLSDLILEEDDEDIKNLLRSVQSDQSSSISQSSKDMRPSSSSKRTRRSSKTSPINNKDNEYIFDEEHLLELLKRLKQQPGHTAAPMTADDELHLLETLLQLYPASADLIRDRFGTVFESKRTQPKEFTPNVDNCSLALDTTVDNLLHSYFMLFCRRCHRYDCFLHRDKQPTPDLTVKPKKFHSLYRPCGRHCYQMNGVSSRSAKIELKRSFSELPDNKTSKIPINGFHSKRPKLSIVKSEPLSPNLNGLTNGFLLKPSVKRKLTDEILEWSPSDKSLFRVFHTIYGDNVCMIADLLGKPCSQVYMFYNNEVLVNEKNLLLQRQNSSASTSTIESFSGITSSLSSDSGDVRINGEHKKKKLNGAKATTTDGIEGSLPKENGKDDHHLTNHCRSSSASRRTHSSSFRRQRSYQQILLTHHNNHSSEKKRHTYYPCDHDRSMPCNEDCFCVRSGNFCEKYCCCSSTKCDNRFPGCRCRSSCTTKQCPCYAAARECDPDLCTQCGADDFRSVNNELKTSTSCSCHNVAIQRSLHKPLLLAESDVAGWGIFTQVNIQRNEFIAEYCGEILTQDEGELRGRMYDTIGTSFLFDLNEEYMVDATRRGNKIRFANHSINPNCYAKVIMVNGDHRIGIYCKRSINAGEELFFDYRYGANHHLRFVGVEKNTSADQLDT
ncbi:unnamed protein product [Adineta ricciae]|uniref:[histone H3]-lysine(27) N-trimethyltransferase n=1 Tax=Adineta ricciae TaxID=249248 RepID=A0A815S3X8_ADIRI|nr:unnamed protein product [Adineta ricciae]CAF1485083.1 unnamed protein product [Adineta ricciae]